MATRTAISDSLENLSVEELQKLKLQEEILNLKKPVWKQVQFLSVIVTLIIAFTGTSITLWQIQGNKVQYAENERNKYQKMMEELEAERNSLRERTAETNVRFQEALAEKNIALSEKSEISNKVNSIQEMQLIARERALSNNIKRLQNMNKTLEKVSRNYKEQFIETYVSKNATIQSDIMKFGKEGMKPQMETWLKEQFLFTALNRYQNFIDQEMKTGLPIE